jgi:hypothetical protein
MEWLHPFPDLLDTGTRSTNDKPCFACGLPGFVEAVWQEQGGNWFCSSQCLRLTEEHGRPCALGVDCLRASNRRGHPVVGRSPYCSKNCEARARIYARKRRQAYIAFGGQIEASEPRINSGFQRPISAGDRQSGHPEA